MKRRNTRAHNHGQPLLHRDSHSGEGSMWHQFHWSRIMQGIPVEPGLA